MTEEAHAAVAQLPSLTEEQRRLASATIDDLLDTRPDAAALEQRNVLATASPTVAGALQGVQKQLQHQMRTDELAHRLETRPDVQELRDQSIVHDSDGVAPILQATQEKLQRQLKTDKVSQSLSKRPSREKLRLTGVLDTRSDVAPRLTAAAKQLEKQLRQDHVAQLLEARPEKEELVLHHILPDQEVAVAPGLQGATQELERQLKADQVARQLRHRPAVTDLEKRGIIDEGELGDDALPTKEQLLSQRARYASALRAVNQLAAEKLISAEEKARLKDLVLSDNDTIVAALESYALDEDKEERLDAVHRALTEVSP